ncbi:hypothetical protein BH09ACT8_BH09ACT8_19480 [soil metagenome]
MHVQARLPDELYGQLKSIAKERQCSTSAVVRWAIEDYVAGYSPLGESGEAGLTGRELSG